MKSGVWVVIFVDLEKKLAVRMVLSSRRLPVDVHTMMIYPQDSPRSYVEIYIHIYILIFNKESTVQTKIFSSWSKHLFYWSKKILRRLRELFLYVHTILKKILQYCILVRQATVLPWYNLLLYFETILSNNTGALSLK